MTGKIANYLRLKHPDIYTRLVHLLTILKPKNKTIHILDNYGGDFKKYMFEKPMKEVIQKLTSNLDDYSKKTIEVIVERMLNYPNRRHGIQINTTYNNVVGELLDEESVKAKQKIEKELKLLSNKIKFPHYNMDASVFYYDHGLTLMPREVGNYLSGSHFLDLGAFSGDSAIALDKYSYSKIYSVEMSEKAIQNYQVNVARNNIEASRYQIIRAAIAENDESEPIYFSDHSYTVFSEKLTDKTNAKYKVFKRSVDSLADEYNIKPKLIKADIEGFGLECVKGAVKTLVKNRSILSLAIYHNPYEFFETKPFLEQHLENYTFMVRKLASSPFGLRCHAETILLAYPNEIVK